MKKWIALLLLAVLCFLNYFQYDTLEQDPYLITDYGRLRPVKVTGVAKGREEDQLRGILQEARDKHLTISIAGQRHSQGGHTYYKDSIVVDMTSYNRVLDFDQQKKKIRIQAGATWKDVQDYVNPYGLAVKTMQSQNIFTIGGSLSVNAHGRDIRNGSLIKSVESFRLLTADDRILNVSRHENADLFGFVIGGYGLFGIILDVTLTLTDNEMYKLAVDNLDVASYSRYFAEHVKTNPDIHLHIARISVAPEHFLTEMYAINYVLDRSVPLKGYDQLKTQEEGVILSKLLFNLNRTFGWGKNVLWNLQKPYFTKQQGTWITRNNAMRSESEFMEYRQAGSNDVLQEYFLPVQEFAGFVDDLRAVLQVENLNLLNITVRYVNHDEEATLSYATDDMFALVCLFNVPLSKEGQDKVRTGIQAVLDRVIQHNGTYYLPYIAYPRLDQFRAAYPRYADFFRKKEQYDPNHLFVNYFYMDYKGE
ncbi:decaprenylphospho-beta-D-ribofuranose 2-oxidase [Paenibacillus sp. V4I3]|uniref:FAD-binding oxidoreductase n=1 Tax=Paenibacillus sp. V4I3 TaxID=3042305 RepID=UPI002784C9B8|nr:FAD-binding oxidoreductase [Paenibacillus sp. V4I3]MDQ0878670.1 decaprenylphospho-beta-D-ribofuranose 2-oxidase [Paenibacillus sp. V4I3]